MKYPKYALEALRKYESRTGFKLEGKARENFLRNVMNMKKVSRFIKQLQVRKHG